MTDEQLATWLRSVNLEPGSDRQFAIGEAASALAASAEPKQIIGYVLLAHGLGDSASFSLLRDGISEHDPTFGCSIDDLETCLAAAVCVAAAMEGNPVCTSLAAAHGVLSAEWVGLANPIPELAHLAKETIHRRGGSIRSHGAITVAADFQTAIASIPELAQDGAGMLHQDGRKLGEAISAGFDAVKKSLESLARRTTTRMQSSDEELDILWWAFSGYSETLKKAWKDVANDGLLSIALALELFSLLRFLVGPQSTSAILARLLGSRANHEVALTAAISATGKQGLSVQIAEGHPLLPVLSSLSEFSALNGKPAWKESVSRWSIDPTRPSMCLELAEQCVRELCLNGLMASR
jgi:hypothetical protein